MITVRKSHERGHAVHGWLDSWHSFSFADYYDENWMGFRSLRVINDDRIAPGHGFGMHPHRDMEILTYLVSGTLEHKDSMGNGRIIHPGEVQYMSAASGVYHSEFNPSPTDPCHLLQIWIEPETKGGEPRYADRSLDSVPPGTFQLIASKQGRLGSFSIRQDADLWSCSMLPGNTATHPLSQGRHAWLQVATGSVKVNGIALSQGDALAATDPASLDLTLAAQERSQVLLFDLA